MTFRTISMILFFSIFTSPVVAAEDYLVWWQSEDGTAKTSWIQSDDGKVETLGTRDGVVVAVKAGLVELALGEQTIRTLDCECESDESKCSKVTTVTSPTLLVRNLASGATTIHLEVTPTTVGEVSPQTVNILATLGSYLLVDAQSWEYGCGAHGSAYASFQVLDLETGNKVDIFGDAETQKALKSARNAAFAQMKAADKSMDDIGSGDDLTPVSASPFIKKGGLLGFAYLMSGSACYACGDNVWGSYSVSERVESDVVPKTLAAGAKPPKAVLETLRAQGQIGSFGWSQVDAPNDRAIFLALFRDGNAKVPASKK